MISKLIEILLQWVMLFIVIFLALFLMFGEVKAEEESINVKFGGVEFLCEGIDASPRIEVSYEYIPDLTNDLKVGVECGIGGIETLVHDTQKETPYVGKAAGRLFTFDYFLTLKWYFKEDLHVGLGVDYKDHYFRPYYYKDVKADWDDEVGCHAQLGWEFTDNWTAIFKGGWSDIDVERLVDPSYGHGYKFTNGILEGQSNEHYIGFMIERKWGF